MRVAMYAPHKLYGFAETVDGGRVFFHVQVFVPDPGGPPPIVGERVEVQAEGPVEARQGGRCPRALSVSRLDAPTRLTGVVDDFNPSKGWGFILDPSGQSYYLHRSEVLGGKLPLKGRRVAFYKGQARGRPRACHIEVDPDE